MNADLKQRARKLTRWAIGIFILLFAFRLLYGYTLSDTVQLRDYAEDFFSGLDLRKNYASEKGWSKGDAKGQSGGTAPAFSASQKYEKTANTRSRTTTFEKDHTTLNDQIKTFRGVVQYEQRSGNPGDRELHLLIGIDPEKFDDFYAKVQTIGTVRSTAVTKVDKSNEYRELNAKKASLEKILGSLNELKNKSGQIADYIALHDKILDIESQLQELGVDLGNFDTENEFCSVRFSLLEGATEEKIRFLQRFKVALEWTLQFYALAIVCIFCVSLGALVIVVLAEKIRGMMAGTWK